MMPTKGDPVSASAAGTINQEAAAPASLRAIAIGVAVSIGVSIAAVALATVASLPFHDDADGANLAPAGGFLLGLPFAAFAGGWAAGHRSSRQSPAVHGALATVVPWLAADTVLALAGPGTLDRLPGVSIFGVAVVVLGALGGGIAGWLGRFRDPSPSTPGGGPRRRRWRRHGRR